MSQAPPGRLAPGTGAPIFISYRREDSAGHTGRLYDGLRGYFGDAQIFRDLDHIAPGRSFPRTIEAALASARVLIAVIGRRWLEGSPDQGSRLNDPNDFVRLEIVTALKRDILVIPVLVENASMPGRSQLPPSMAKLATIQAIHMSDQRWDEDLRRLIGVLQSEAGLQGRAQAAQPSVQRPRPATLAEQMARTSPDLSAGFAGRSSLLRQETPAQREQRERWRSEYQEREKAERLRRERARATKPKFYACLSWWGLLLLTLALTVGASFFAEWVVNWGVSVFGQRLPEVESVSQIMIAMGLVWTVVYVTTATARYRYDPERSLLSCFAMGMFGPWGLGFVELNVVTAVIGGFPLVMVTGWGLARAAALAASTFLGANYTGVAIIALALYTIFVVASYALLWFDDLANS